MSRSPGGFTLLELMISILIIGMIAGILTGALRLGINTVNSGEEKISSLQRLGSSVNIINAQIQSLSPLTFIDDGQERYFFEGDGESIRFSSNYSVWSGQQGYVLVGYRVEKGDDGKQSLYVTESLIGSETMRETMLLDSLDMVEFEYYYHSPLEEAGEWLTGWDDALSLPGKVRLTLMRGSDDYSLVIPVRVAAALPGGILQP